MKFGMWEEGYILGGVTRSEGRRLARLAAQVPAGQCIVELGAHGGASTSWLAVGVRKSRRGTPIYAIDPWTLAVGERMEQHAAEAVYRRFLAQLDFMASGGYIDRPTVRPIQGFSVEEAARWDGEPVGLLHVDALHTLEAVRADLQAWIPHLASRASVVLHDYSDRRFGVRQAGDELAARKGWVTIGIYPGDRRKGRHGQMVLRAP